MAMWLLESSIHPHAHASAMSEWPVYISYLFWWFLVVLEVRRSSLWVTTGGHWSF